MSSKWERLLKNAGTWVGSFTSLSPVGEVLVDTPTVVTLEPFDGAKAMRQTILKSPLGEVPQETVLEYRSLGKSVLFFESGEFSQGSIQWGPFSEFGAEMGFIADPHRLRMVQVFSKDRQLANLTLIRECREGTDPSQRTHLTLDDLVGVWQGEAITLYPDFQPSETYGTRLEVDCTSDRVQQTLRIGKNAPPIRSEGRLMGDQRIVFESGSQTVQVLLLPDGASSTCPTHIEPRQALFLEAGWLVAPNRRQRLIRQYTAQGSWASLTLVTETRV